MAGSAPDKPYNPGRVAWPDWYLIWDYCVGFICNWACAISTRPTGAAPRWARSRLNWNAGPITATSFTDNVNGWDATFTYPGGLKMIFKDSDKLLQGCRFIGEEGWVRVPPGLQAEPESLLTVEFKESDAPDGFHESCGQFPGLHEDPQRPVSSVDSAHIATSLGILADIAARHGTEGGVGPGAERFVDNDAANAMLHRDMHNRMGVIPCALHRFRPWSRGWRCLRSPGASGAEAPFGWQVGPTAWTFNRFTLFEAIDKTASVELGYIEAFEGQRVRPDADLKLHAALSDEAIQALRAKLDACRVKMPGIYIHTIPGKPAARRSSSPANWA